MNSKKENIKENVMKVSVVVPVYNAESTIKRCLLSILNQTYENIEIIVINDGSKDDSLKVLQELSLEYKDIKVFSKENGGVSSARNKGIELCTGSYLIFVDSDDYIDENYIEELMNIVRTKNLDFVSCGIKYENKHGKELKKVVQKPKVCFDKDMGEVLSSIQKSFIFGKMYNLNLIKKNSVKFNENISLGEDSLFVLNYVFYIENGVGTIDNTFYHYVDENTLSLSKKYHSDIKEIYTQIYEANYRLSKKFMNYKIPYRKEKLIFTMDIRNMYTDSSPLTKKERIKKIKHYMNDIETKNALIEAEKEDKIDKINKYLFILKLPRTMDFIYFFIYKIKKYILKK